MKEEGVRTGKPAWRAMGNEAERERSEAERGDSTRDEEEEEEGEEEVVESARAE